jgi:hypothetical protein
MEQGKPVSKSRVALTWIMMVGLIFAISTFFFFFGHNSVAPPPEETGTPAANPVVHAVVFLFFGIVGLVAGVAGYFIVIGTVCFTFDYSRPVWDTVKVKQFIFNIIVVVAFGSGLGMMVAAVLAPVLTGMGLQGTQADLFPVLAVLIVIQLMQLWVLVWSPVEKRLIVKRLGALGITPEQLQGATLVGLSDPASGITRRFGAIEEDMGALWVAPDRLAFRGDREQFDLTREQIAQVERRADNRSATVLAGIAHVILHVRLPIGTVRQIRLHVEGLWTMGQKRRAMNALAEAIDRWHAGGGS